MVGSEGAVCPPCVLLASEPRQHLGIIAARACEVGALPPHLAVQQRLRGENRRREFGEGRFDPAGRCSHSETPARPAPKRSRRPRKAPAKPKAALAAKPPEMNAEKDEAMQGAFSPPVATAMSDLPPKPLNTRDRSASKGVMLALEQLQDEVDDAGARRRQQHDGRHDSEQEPRPVDDLALEILGIAAVGELVVRRAGHGHSGVSDRDCAMRENHQLNQWDSEFQTSSRRWKRPQMPAF